MNQLKWFCKAEEISSLENLFLFNVTPDIMNEFETDAENNYWKYCSLEEIKDKLQNKYRIPREAVVGLYSTGKLMMVARFAWLLYWIGYDRIKIVIGKIDSSQVNANSSQPVDLPDVPLRSEVRLTCDDLFPPNTKYLDVRTYDEYSGKITGYSYVHRAGHIPNFIHDPLDGSYGLLNGDVTWNELEEYLRLMARFHRPESGVERIVYTCATGWRASLAAIFAEELHLADTIAVLDSGWFEWSERFVE